MSVKRGDYGSPWVYGTGVTPKSSAAGRASGLRGRNYVTEVFNGTGAQQYFPMGFPGVRGKGCRQQEAVNAALTSEKLREPQVIAHSKTDADVRAVF